MIALRDRPEPPGPSCIGENSLVARTIVLAAVYFRIARPTISSELPWP